MIQIAFAVAATLVAVAFALSTFERWLVGRARHEAAWSVALAMFAIASGFLAAGAGLGWNEWTFRGFYFFGAIANVPFLACGSVYLLAGRRAGDRAMAAVAVAVAFAAGVVAVAPLTSSVPSDELARGSEVFGPLPRVLAATASAGGAVVVFGGAVWSALNHPARRMVVANVLIAIGTLVTGASGLLNSLLDEMTGFAVTLVAGITLLFGGFLVAMTARQRPDITARQRPKGALPTAAIAPTAAPGGEASRRDHVAAPPRT